MMTRIEMYARWLAAIFLTGSFMILVGVIINEIIKIVEGGIK